MSLATFDTATFWALHSLVGRFNALDGVIVIFASILPYLLTGLFLWFVLFTRELDKRRVEILSVAILSTVVAHFGVITLIHAWYTRLRPFAAFQFHPLLLEQSSSFPSMHATFLFGLFTLVYLYDRRWSGVFFLLAALSVVARVAVGLHYPSDVVAGALIGALVSYGCYRVLHKPFHPHQVRQNRA